MIIRFWWLSALRNIKIYCLYKRIMQKNFTRKYRMRSRKITKRRRGGGQQQSMKVAVMFVGRIKGYVPYLSKLLEFKNRYAPTYYCSLNRPADNEEATKLFDDDVHKFSRELGIIPENMNLETTPLPDFLKDVKDYKSWNPNNAYSMFYHENKAFSLIEKDVIRNKRQYDCILYCRADMNSEDILVLEFPKPNVIYIPSGEDFDGINDKLAYGSFDSMKKYCSVIKLLTSAESMNGMMPESILKRHLDNEKLEIVRIKYGTVSLSEERKSTYNS
jgi:hypothetical protein